MLASVCLFPVNFYVCACFCVPVPRTNPALEDGRESVTMAMRGKFNSRVNKIYQRVTNEDIVSYKPVSLAAPKGHINIK